MNMPPSVPNPNQHTAATGAGILRSPEELFTGNTLPSTQGVGIFPAAQASVHPERSHNTTPTQGQAYPQQNEGITLPSDEKGNALRHTVGFVTGKLLAGAIISKVSARVAEYRWKREAERATKEATLDARAIDPNEVSLRQHIPKVIGAYTLAHLGLNIARHIPGVGDALNSLTGFTDDLLGGATGFGNQSHTGNNAASSEKTLFTIETSDAKQTHSVEGAKVPAHPKPVNITPDTTFRAESGDGAIKVSKRIFEDQAHRMGVTLDADKLSQKQIRAIEHAFTDDPKNAGAFYGENDNLMRLKAKYHTGDAREAAAAIIENLTPDESESARHTAEPKPTPPNQLKEPPTDIQVSVSDPSIKPTPEAPVIASAVTPLSENEARVALAVEEGKTTLLDGAKIILGGSLAVTATAGAVGAAVARHYSRRERTDDEHYREGGLVALGLVHPYEQQAAQTSTPPHEQADDEDDLAGPTKNVIRRT